MGVYPTGGYSTGGSPTGGYPRVQPSSPGLESSAFVDAVEDVLQSRRSAVSRGCKHGSNNMAILIQLTS